jgi:hypothetical protein
MAALGYQGGAFDSDAITRYRDPFEKIHDNFPVDYSSDPSRHDREIERWHHVTSPIPLSDEEARSWFLYPETYRRLRDAVGG